MVFLYLIKIVMEISSLAGFFWNCRFLFDLCWTVITTQQPMHRRQPTKQRRQHFLSYNNACSHNQTQPNTNTNTTKHNTHFQHKCMPTSFQVARGLHDTNMFAKQGMRQCTGTLTLRQVRAVRADWTSDHCHCCWEKREKTREGREKGKRNPTHTPFLPHRVQVKNVSVCRFKTFPCVLAKRAHVNTGHVRPAISSYQPAKLTSTACVASTSAEPQLDILVSTMFWRRGKRMLGLFPIQARRRRTM